MDVSRSVKPSVDGGVRRTSWAVAGTHERDIYCAYMSCGGYQHMDYPNTIGRSALGGI